MCAEFSNGSLFFYLAVQCYLESAAKQDVPNHRLQSTKGHDFVLTLVVVSERDSKGQCVVLIVGLLIQAAAESTAVLTPDRKYLSDGSHRVRNLAMLQKMVYSPVVYHLTGMYILTADPI